MSTPGTVNYPASGDDAVSLLEATNGASTVLSSALAIDAVTADVISTALFPSTGAVVFNGVEIAYYTGKTSTSFTGLIRGSDGTTAVAHASGVGAQGRMIARHHRVLAEAIIATQTEIDSQTAAIVASIVSLDVAKADAATTLAGYGITDVYTKAVADLRYAASVHDHDERYFTETESDLRFAARAHTHALSDITGLISGGKIATGLLPSIAITDTFVVASQAAMLALTAETGDIAVRSDQSKTYILKGTNPAVLADWELLQTPTDAVLSVNGQTGVVSLTAANVGALAQAAADALYSALGHTHTFASLTSKPTTLAGYGIVDAAALSHVHAAADITSGTFADSFLATIATAGKVSNSATTATSVNTFSAIVARDGSGNFTAGTITASLTGHASLDLALAGGTMTGQITSALGTITTDIRAFSASATWNASGTIFYGIFFNATQTAYSASSQLMDIRGNNTTMFRVSAIGYCFAYNRFQAPSLYNSATTAGIVSTGFKLGSARSIAWEATDTAYNGTADTGIYRNAAGVLEINNGTAGTYRDIKVRDIILDGTNLAKSSTAFADGAAAAAGTLGNAPVAGNPTKWVPINDNGTVRYIPAW